MSEVPLLALLPKLFSVISAHLPLVYRPSALLSLVLTCYRLHDIVIPHLLLNDDRLAGEHQALPVLTDFIAKAELVTEEDIQKEGNPSPSHCIHHLCIDPSIKTPVGSEDNHSLKALQKLIDVDGLRHLSALTLHVRILWNGEWEEDLFDIFRVFPWTFFAYLERKCPGLKSVNLTEVAHIPKEEWIERAILSSENLTSIRLQGFLSKEDDMTRTFDILQFPPNLHTLELSLQPSEYPEYIEASSPNGLLNISTSAPKANFLWAHPKIERLEVCRDNIGSLFTDFHIGMLPNLAYLQCDINDAIVLVPKVSNTLVTLSVLGTYNAQGAYLLHSAIPGGVLPNLRSLTIQKKSGNSPKPREGHRWMEDDNGTVSEADAKKAARYFDRNYITSLSKAAPNLEELELMGTSDDTIESITSALSKISKIQRLTLSGPTNFVNKPFFESCYDWADYASYELGNLSSMKFRKYVPESFEEAARDLANGCRTLDFITVGNMTGELRQEGPSARIVRECKGGAVKELRRVQAWGNIVGREEEW